MKELFYIIVLIMIVSILFLYINTRECSFKSNFQNVLTKNIPLIIHQTWITKNPKGKFKRASNSWKELNPEFEHIIYDDNECTEFISKHYPQYIKFYNELKLPVQKADIFRYLIIHKYGGVYTDMDTKCLKPIKEILNAPMVVGIEYLPEHNKGVTQIIQWFFASVPGNPAFIEIIEKVKHRHKIMKTYGSFIPLLLDGRRVFQKDEETLWLTGPYIFSDVVLNIPEEYIKIYPRCTFGSFDTSESCRSKSYLIHGFEGSWKVNKKIYPLQL